jgi:hypothetical protein
MSLSHVRQIASGRVVRSQVYTYEERLSEVPGFRVAETEAYFGGRRLAAMDTMRRLARRLDELGVPYAVVGALALNAHKYERFTIDADVIVRRESLPVIHGALDGLGWLPPFEGSKNLRDTTNGVRVDFLIAGGFPGDGKEKPIDFPDPGQGTVEIDGVRFVTLEKLVELKLASGISNFNRMRDLGDVQSMIHALKLPRSFGDKLHPYVRGKFDEFWLAWEADPLKDEY